MTKEWIQRFLGRNTGNRLLTLLAILGHIMVHGLQWYLISAELTKYWEI